MHLKTPMVPVFLVVGILLSVLSFSLYQVNKNNHPSSPYVIKVRATLPEFYYYKIVGLPDTSVENAVNKKLFDLSKTFGCPKTNDSHDNENFFNLDWNVTYFKNNIMSNHIVAAEFCGGLHPEDLDESMTFDLLTGKEIVFEDLFMDYKKNTWQILSIIFKEGIEEYEQSQKEGNIDSGCLQMYSKENLMSEFSNFDYYITPEGKLSVNLNLPRVVMSFCSTDGEDVDISDLNSYISAKGMLSRLIK